jgi:cytidine deaminase
MAASGAVVTGCNVENASFGISVCAERVAIQSAVAQGHRRLVAVAVAADRSAAMPCGACRQVMAEFGVRTVIVAGPSGSPLVFRLGDLLAHPFGRADLS